MPLRVTVAATPQLYDNVLWPSLERVIARNRRWKSSKARWMERRTHHVEHALHPHADRHLVKHLKRALARLAERHFFMCAQGFDELLPNRHHRVQ